MVEVHALAAIATKTMDAVNVFAGAIADFKQRKLSILWTIWHYIMFFFGYGKGYDHIYISALVYYFSKLSEPIYKPSNDIYVALPLDFHFTQLERAQLSNEEALLRTVRAYIMSDAPIERAVCSVSH